MQTQPSAWWSEDIAALTARLHSSPWGLTDDQVSRAQKDFGPNALAPERSSTWWALAWRQVSSPWMALLLVAAVLALWVNQWAQALTIVAMVVLGAGLTTWQELRAGATLQALRQRLELQVSVYRGGQLRSIASTCLVPGDVMELRAGQAVPADGRILHAVGCLVSEASLTGESLPVDKRPAHATARTPLALRENCVHAGTSLQAGFARVLVVKTGNATVMAGIAQRTTTTPPLTDLTRGVNQVGQRMAQWMWVAVVGLLVISQWQGRPWSDTLTYALALAVGLSPELLPAIVTVGLSHGARQLAHQGVWIRQLQSVDSLGAVDTLCTDKTGTLTHGQLQWLDSRDAQGQPSEQVARWAALNAWMQTGADNPLDNALREGARQRQWAPQHCLLDRELPYDFRRRRLSVCVRCPDPGAASAWGLAAGTAVWITKGAPREVLAICTRMRSSQEATRLDESWRSQILEQVESMAQSGLRVLAVATRCRAESPGPGAHVESMAPSDDWGPESDMTFEGLVGFADPLREDARQWVQALGDCGIQVKMITGDNRYVAARVAKAVGLREQGLLTGEELLALRDDALRHRVEEVDIFVEMDPAQKERIVRALQHRGSVVGYLGDGINDVAAMHAADVAISVDGAVDVAQQSADIVLLRPQLSLLLSGVLEGRRCLINTLKYLRITVSANLGNMISMAAATPWLAYLPMSAPQVLLNNLLSDLPALTLATDTVQPEQLRQPLRWQGHALLREMMALGLLSAAFDALTFILLAAVLHAHEAAFQTSWFMVSLLTELGLLLVLRSPLTMARSWPSPLVLGSVVAVALVALAWPLIPALARPMGFEPLPMLWWGWLGVVIIACVWSTDRLKSRWRSH